MKEKLMLTIFPIELCSNHTSLQKSRRLQRIFYFMLKVSEFVLFRAIYSLFEQVVQLFRVMVSAKDSDGSVHQAMQTLIRKLMENTLQQMYGDEYKKRSKRRPKKQSKAIVETSLKLTEIESVSCGSCLANIHYCSSV